ncbi:hypothetical protein [Modestobacter altitudinis]|uniref:hypothetical protein n=1 Tax=Modestobacter altitudinis TaxID=2213158 RepID=UPI00110CCD07|nr:hypothetical protein [Modestobacter altitudinis]
MTTSLEEEATGDVVHGLLRLAGMDVALPLSVLREVVPCPTELAGLPAAAPACWGRSSYVGWSCRCWICRP